MNTPVTWEQLDNGDSRNLKFIPAEYQLLLETNTADLCMGLAVGPLRLYPPLPSSLTMLQGLFLPPTPCFLKCQICSYFLPLYLLFPLTLVLLEIFAWLASSCQSSLSSNITSLDKCSTYLTPSFFTFIFFIVFNTL